MFSFCSEGAAANMEKNKDKKKEKEKKKKEAANESVK